MSHTVLTEDEFIARFKPETDAEGNHYVVRNAYAKEDAAAIELAKKENRIWSQMDGDSGSWRLTSGCLVVNFNHYIITDVPVPDDEDFTVEGDKELEADGAPQPLWKTDHEDDLTTKHDTFFVLRENQYGHEVEAVRGTAIEGPIIAFDCFIPGFLQALVFEHNARKDESAETDEAAVRVQYDSDGRVEQIIIRKDLRDKVVYDEQDSTWYARRHEAESLQ